MRFALVISLAVAVAFLLLFDQAKARQGADAGLEQDYTWSESIHVPAATQVMMTPLVADLDHDGTSEIVFTSFSGADDISVGEDGVLRVVSGVDASELFSVSEPGCQICFGDDTCTELNARGGPGVFSPGSGLALGDIDGDGSVELVGLLEGEFETQATRLLALEPDGSFLWCSQKLSVPLDPYTHVSLADVDSDGSPELVAGSVLFQADGQIAWDGGRTRTTMVTAIADLDGDSTAEIITGARVFEPDGTLVWDRSDLTGDIFFPAVADFDLDGIPEVVSVDHQGSRIYLLEGSTGITRCTADLENGGVLQLGGPPSLADVDGDCIPEIAVAGKSSIALFVYDPDADGTACLVKSWTGVTEDTTSSHSTPTFFDLDGDGSLELIYADEKTIRVYNALDGTVVSQLENSSATALENPVIVDANGDGQAQILITANDYGREGQHGLRVLHDPTVIWAPARAIWNQHAYHRTNIEDDGSIPSPEQQSWIEHNHYRSQIGAVCGDADGDGVANGDDNCPSESNPAQENADADPAGDACDCDDADPDIYPGAPQLCDEKNNDCEDANWPTVPADESDSDGDLFLACADCDDGDAEVCPGCEQLCDQKNNDCDLPGWPTVPATETDDDLDGFAECENDCNDEDDTLYPAAPQLCDGKNNDCDDSNWPTLPASEADADGDTHMACQGDCDDGDATTYPGASQLCDGLNNDCNHASWPEPPADEADADEDNYRPCSGDCDDSDPARNPGAEESCNSIDDDCNDLVDDDEWGEDSDSDGIHNVCDNCLFDQNASQADMDGDLVGDACDNCLEVDNPTQKDGDADDVGNLCDNCAHAANPGQEDADSDRVGDVCDNCLNDANTAQHDLDSDNQGDLCDLDDGVILFGQIDHPTVRWQSDPLYSAYNLYRGDLAVLLGGGAFTQAPGSNAYADRFCDQAGTFLDDSLVPSPAESFYWLITGEGVGGESTLGDGTDQTRANDNPCP